MSLSVCCIASGSKGNCTYVTDGNNTILVDLGIPATNCEKALAVLGADIDRCDIIVTHSHSDHIGGIKTFIKHHPGVRVHCQKESAAAVEYLTGVTPVIEPREFSVGGVNITALPAPHDVPCFGYMLDSLGKRAAIVTDVGNVDEKLLNALCSAQLVILEANHDVQMLRNNAKYTAQLKARILSPHGHLSNADCAAAAAYLAATGVKSIVLAHLSEENNTPETAMREVSRAVEEAGAAIAITVAYQHQMTGLFDIC